MTRSASKSSHGPISVTSPSNVVAGQILKIGALVCMATNTASTGETLAVEVGTVVSAPAETGQAWTQFQLLYWDDTEHRFTTTAGSNEVGGVAAAPKLSATATGLVRMLKAPVPAEGLVLAPPVLDSIDPGDADQGDEGVIIVLTGSAFVSGCTVSFSGTGVDVVGVTFNSTTELEVEVDIDPAAAATARNVTVTNPDTQSDTLVGAFEVTTAPVLAPPVLDSIDPEDATQGDEGVIVTLTGSAFVSGATVAFSGSGITVVGVTFNSTTELEVEIDVDPAAAATARNVTVTNPDLQSDTLAAAFTVMASAAAPAIATVSPGFWPRNANDLAIVITGTGFVSGCTVAFGGTGITGSAVTFVNSTTLTMTVDTDVAATLGNRSCTVTNPDTQDGVLSVAVTMCEVMTTAHRTTGVAPLSVFFDAVDVGAGSTLVEQPASGNFGDNDHRYNYGDTSATTFATNGLTSNVGIGAVGHHVYETAGVYVAVLRHRNDAGTLHRYAQIITVTDPATVFAGWTRYVKNGGNNAASGLDDANAWETFGHAITQLYASNGDRRIRLKGGQTFVDSTGYYFSSETGAKLIDTYGGGTATIDASGWAGTGSDTFLGIETTAVDLRVVDVVLAGGDTGRGMHPGVNTLFLRGGINHFNWNVRLPDTESCTDNAFVRATIVDGEQEGGSPGYGFFAGQAKRLAVAGCTLQGGAGMWGGSIRSYVSRAVYDSNLFGPQPSNSLKILGRGGDTTEFVCATRNRFASGSGEVLWVSPENDSNQAVDNVLVEANDFNETGSFNLIEVCGTRITIRNNTASIQGNTFCQIGGLGASQPTPSNVRLDNNTVTVPGNPGGNWYLVYVEAGITTGILIRNNIVWCAHTAGTVKDPGGTGTTTLTTNRTTAPTFVNEGTRDYHLQSGSGARGAGTDAIVYYDFDDVDRADADGTDQGAYEYVP